MMYKSFILADLITAYLSGEITAEQQVELNTWLDASAENRTLFEHLTSPEYLHSKQEIYRRFNAYYSPREFRHKMQSRQQYRVFRRVAWSAAAILIPLMVYVGYFSFSPESELIVVSESQPVTIHGTTLRLDDGRVESLHAPIVVDNAYRDKYSPPRHSAISKHIVDVPRGTDFHLTLADGTKVHLNAMSRLRFPTDFTGNATRHVYLEGEALFEVTHDSQKPFIVETENCTVQVYGTKFVVSNYTPESTRTILVEGSVGVKTVDGQQAILQPNQMALVDKDISHVEISDVDTYHYLAWTKGFFFFNNIPLREIAAQLVKWYDVEFYFNDATVANEPVVASFSHDVTIQDIIKTLAKITNVKFTIKGRRIYIE